MGSVRYVSFTISFVIFLTFEGMLISLAHWQYGRMHEQKELFSYVQTVADESFAPLENLSEYNEWQPVSLQGQFDFSRQKTLINQRLADGVGVRLVAPFILTDGREVLVDRGWASAREDFARLQTQQEAIQGFIRHQKPLSGWFKGPVYGLNESELMRLEFSAFGENEKRLPVYVQATASSDSSIKSVPDYPKNGSKNFEYMITWSLCAAVLLLLYVYTVWARLRKI